MTASTDVKGLSKSSSYSVTMHVTSASDVDDTARSNRRTLIRAYEDQLAGHFDGWWSIFDNGVEFHEADSLPYGCSVKGLAAAQQGMHGMFAAWSDLTIDFEEFLTAGDIVIAYIQMRAVSKKTGRVYEGPVAELFRFRDGKVVEWRPIYWDTHKALQACGEN